MNWFVNRRYSDFVWLHQALLDLYTDCQSAIPVLYNWTSVPAISGNSETHILAQVDSESINDGEPVSDLLASDFIALPDAIKVKALADARVRE